jgi:hypothetical protein
MECTLIEEILKDPKKRKEIPDISYCDASIVTWNFGILFFL